jgi:hypothetical protein
VDARIAADGTIGAVERQAPAGWSRRPRARTISVATITCLHDDRSVFDRARTATCARLLGVATDPALVAGSG